MDIVRRVDPEKYYEDANSDNDDVFSDVKILKRKMEVLREITFEEQATVWSISMTKDNTAAWMGVGHGPFAEESRCPCSLYKVSLSGEILAKVVLTFWPYHVAVTSNDDVLVTSGWTSSVIKRVRSNGDVTDFAVMTPFWVYGLIVDNTDQVMVCLHSKGHYNGRVTLLSNTGKAVRDIVTDRFGQWIFTHPFSMTTSPEKCILFKDGMDLISLDPSGLVCSTRRPMKRMWNVKGFTCDHFGHVIGGARESIHVTNMAGEWLHSFTDLFLQDQNVHGIQLDNENNLWIGTNCGKLFIVKYLE